MQLLIVASALLALATVVVCHPHKNSEIKKNFEDCLAESGATKEDLKKGEPTKEIGCFSGCMAEKTGALKDGKLDATGMTHMVKDEAKKAELEKCLAEIDATGDKCTVGGEISACAAKARPPRE